MSGRVTKSVYFGMSDELDALLLEHALKVNRLSGKSRNFSKYIKRLIENDMNKNSLQNNMSIVDVEIEKEDIGDMNSFL